MLTSRCNRCLTEFLVTREQLAARAGKVRCGQCQNLFNALDTLSQREAVEMGATATGKPAPAEPAPPTPPAVTPSAAWAPVPFTPPRAGAPIDITTPFDDPEPAPDPTPATPAVAPVPEFAALPSPVDIETTVKDPFLDWPPLDAASPPALDPAAQLATLDTPPPAQVAPMVNASLVPGNAAASASAPTKPQPAAASISAGTSTQSVTSAPAFDFGPPPEEKKSKGWWVFLSLLLLLVLLGQALFYFRGAIALLVPEAKPYIVLFCAEVGCEVPLPRRVELVSIETSDLQADPANPGVMVLSATLRNRAAFPQAFPALELTLTNERDQALARRVLQHTDYLAEKAEAFEGSSEKQIKVYVEASALKPSGYRLYLFYP